METNNGRKQLIALLEESGAGSEVLHEAERRTGPGRFYKWPLAYGEPLFRAGRVIGTMSVYQNGKEITAEIRGVYWDDPLWSYRWESEQHRNLKRNEVAETHAHNSR